MPSWLSRNCVREASHTIPDISYHFGDIGYMFMIYDWFILTRALGSHTAFMKNGRAWFIVSFCWKHLKPLTLNSQQMVVAAGRRAPVSEKSK